MSTAELQGRFEALDTNKDGKLDAAELLAGGGLSEVEAKSLVDFFDYDGDNQLNFAEFVTMQKVFMKQDSSAVEMSAVASAFKAWDKDGSGNLEPSELVSLKTALKIDDATWDNIVSKSDVNKDGFIDRKEFKLMCQAINRKDSFKPKEVVAAPVEVAAAPPAESANNLPLIIGAIAAVAVVAAFIIFNKQAKTVAKK